MHTSIRKQAIALSLMLLATSPAWAEWVEIGSSSGGKTYYIDPATIRKDGNLRKVWALTNYKKRESSGEMSSRSKREYDCINERYRILSLSTHSGLMAEGEILSIGSYRPWEWDDIAPETIGQAYLEFVCAQ